MSTTFGVSKKGKDISMVDDMPVVIIDSEFIEVAFRGNGGILRWTNDLAPLLQDEVKVYPLDNTAQGIHNIGDIRKSIKETGKI
jgi:hypothetical protein